MRFTPAAICTLTDISMMFYDPGSSSGPKEGITVYVWDDDGLGLPGTVVDTIFIRDQWMKYLPDDLNISVYNTGLMFHDQYHVGYRTIDPADTYAILSDDGSQGTMRSSIQVGGVWEDLRSVYGTDYNFLISSEVAYRAPVHPVNQMVTVRSPGNPADITGYGSVGSSYKISRFEITNAQYTEFLNAVAQLADPNGLFNPSMENDGRGGIRQYGNSGSNYYRVKPLMSNKPVNHVSWYDATRYCNWLVNGKPTGNQNAGTTEDGAYDMALTDPIRKAGAWIALPTEDEWYKAAHYDLAAPLNNYWNYPTRSDSPPTKATADDFGNISNPGADVANHEDATWNGITGNVTSVGSAGYQTRTWWGTYDQGGNVFEWTEAMIGSNRVCRGGYFAGTAASLHKTARYSGSPTLETALNGFRVVHPVIQITLQVAGPTLGLGYSWAVYITVHPFHKSGGDKSEFTYLQTHAAGPPAGSDAETFVAWMVANIDSVTGSEILAVQDLEHPERFSISTADGSEITLWVGEYGQEPDCEVNEVGCSFDAIIKKIDPNEPICGDANADQLVNVTDAVYVIAYIFSGGPAPNPLEAGDVNCDGLVNIADVVYLINYIFAGGPAPCDCDPETAKMGGSDVDLHSRQRATLKLATGSSLSSASHAADVAVSSETEIAAVQLAFTIPADLVGRIVPQKTERSEKMQLFYGYSDGQLNVGLICLQGENVIAAGEGTIIKLETSDGMIAQVELATAIVVDRQAQELEVTIEKGSGSALLPSSYALGQNYPNPFNPTTLIQYSLPRASEVRIEIFNILGRKVKTLVDGYQVAGRYEVGWNSTDDNDQAVASGVYLYRISAGEFSETRKMVLMK